MCSPGIADSSPVEWPFETLCCQGTACGATGRSIEDPSLTPAGEVVYIFVKLVKKPLRPEIHVSRDVNNRAQYLRPIQGPRPEEVQHYFFSRYRAGLDCSSNAIENMVAMCLYNYLDSVVCQFCGGTGPSLPDQLDAGALQGSR